MAEIDVEFPPKVVENFNQSAMVRVFKGGRGSAKTMSLAKLSAIYAYKMARAGRKGVWLCGREHLNSLDESSLSEIKFAIASEPFLADAFSVGEKYVRTKDGRIDFAFAGLRHNLDSIKSKARILGAWVDEAESVSEVAWRKLIPTIRDDEAELWVSYNPESEESATHKRFVANPPTGCVITEMNWRDNPWFTAKLNSDRLDDLKYRADTYEHVWEGAFLTLTDAQVFAGKHRVEEFEPFDNDGKLREGWTGPYQGIDFGFRPDPLAAGQLYIGDNRIWIRREAYKAGVEIDATVDFIRRSMPDFDQYASRADSAEPKTISYLSRKGLPRIEPVKKWPNSVEEGVRFIRGYDCVIIHPDCPGTARDFRLYSHKIDRLSGDILPDIVDANNHGPDWVRYAIAPIIKQAAGRKMRVKL